MKKRLIIYAALVGIGVLGYFALQWHARLKNPARKVTSEVFDSFFADLDSARAAVKAGKLAEAERQLNRILVKYRDSADVQHYLVEAEIALADIYAQRKETDRARKAYTGILDKTKNPDVKVRVRIALGTLEARSEGKLELLWKLFHEYRAWPEVSAQICVELADALIAQKHYAEAADIVSEVLTSGRTGRDPLLNRLAGQLETALDRMAAAAGSDAGAGDVYARHARKFPLAADFCRVWLTKAGQLYAKAGRYADARNAFCRIARDYPGEGDAWAAAAKMELGKLDAAEGKARTRLTPGGTDDRVKAGEAIVLAKEPIVKSGTWSPKRGVYVVSGSVEIRRPAQITIEAGTRVEFAMHASLVVYGGLVVQGTAEEPVIFTSAADVPEADRSEADRQRLAASFFDWEGIQFIEGTGSIRHAIIRHAARAVVCEKSQPRLEDVTIAACGIAAVACSNGAAPQIIAPDIRGNDGIAVHFVESGGSIEGGRIAGNPGGAVIARKNSKPVIAGTVLDANGGAVTTGVTAGSSVAAAIQCFDGSDLTLTDVTVSNSLGPGICAIYSMPSLTGCSLDGNADAAVVLESGANARITNTAIRGNASGVKCSVASAPVIKGCTFEANEQFGIRCEGGSNPEITGSRFDKLVGPGIVVRDACRPQLHGNYFPPQGIAIRHEGDNPINASDSVWPTGSDPAKLIEEIGAAKGQVRVK